MKCKNCGTENPEDAQYCRKCGKTFSEKKYRIYWIPIGIGAAIGLILLSIIYTLWGNESMLLDGFIPSIMLSAAIATILSYNKNVRAGYDINSILQGIISGLITGIILLAATIIDNSFVETTLFSLIGGSIFWAFLGSTIGAVINIIREKDKKLLIPTIIIIMTILLLLGYVSTSIKNNGNYLDTFSNEYIDLTEAELLKVEADFYLNKSYTTTKQRKANLKEAQKRYDKIIELTTNALIWNEEAQKIANSDIEHEFIQEMGKYREIKLQYYKLNKEAIDLELQGKTKQAQNKYKEARRLLPKIKAQEKIITVTLEKDQQLKKEIERIKNQVKKFVQHKQENGELLTTSPPEKMPES